MNKNEAIDKIKRQLSEIAKLGIYKTSSGEFKKWRRNTELALEYVFGKETRHLKDFSSIRWTPGAYNMTNPDPAFAKAYQRGLQASSAVLESMIEEVEEYWDDSSQQISRDTLATIENLCSRFHLVARQLRSRYNDRTTIEIEDEYDVQDLLHALLKIEFNDVRAEEWTPSYAGKSSRMDFLLKPEKTVIEVKKTRKSLSSKEVGDQLIIDITRYKAHPDCQVLLCFVYDPEGRIGNPACIENDLGGFHGDLEVKVIISPKGL